MNALDMLAIRLSSDPTIKSLDDRQEVVMRMITLDRAGKPLPRVYDDYLKYALQVYRWMRRDRAIHARILAYHARMVYALSADDRVWDEVDKRLSVERLPISLRDVVAPIEYGATIQELAQAHNVSVRTIQRRLAEARELLA
jgi:hypothetical protein